MRSALCTTNNRTYQVVGFENEANFAVIRRHLVCPECNGQAFYRKQGADGRAAHFGSRYHDVDCNRNQQVTVLLHEEVVAEPRRIIVNFGTGRADAQPVAIDGINANALTWNLRVILSNLLGNPDFIDAPEIFVVPGHGDFVAADLFVNFADITDEQINTFHGYWGEIRSIGFVGNSLWLNTGDRATMSVLLPEQFVAETNERFRVQDSTDYINANMLVFGTLERSQRSGNLQVRISDPSHLIIRLQGL